MGRPDDFMRYQRRDPPERGAEDRTRDYREFVGFLDREEMHRQAARCTDCGIPFCHQFGCPVKNLIPDWNDMVYRGQWKRALDLLHATNNLPEVTGRVCPAPCEPACTLAISEPPVLIKHIEFQIVEKGWQEGWILPQPCTLRTGKKVAVIGSGPAGLSAAQQLARCGHETVVFERADRAGGLLRYGIPDFKLEKPVLDRRLEQMRAEGVIFETGVEVGLDLSVRYLKRTFDAVLLAVGAGMPRDLSIPGRGLDGIHFAMEFLTQQNRRNAGDVIPGEEGISASGKHVVVIGGGDTGSDCIGTSRRQGAKEITQIEILARPPEERTDDNPWPTWPRVFTTSHSQEEGCNRMWSVATKEFIGEKGQVRKLRCVRLDGSFCKESGRPVSKEMPGSEFEIQADLVFLAMGFLGPETGPLTEGFGLDADNRGNLCVNTGFMTSAPGVFATGDSVMGSSLVVRAIDHGRLAAAAVDRYLSGQ